MKAFRMMQNQEDGILKPLIPFEGLLNDRLFFGSPHADGDQALDGR